MATVTFDAAALDRMAHKAAESGLRSALGKAEQLVKEDLSRPGTGRTYGKHRASAPGEPPAPDIGNLRAKTNANPNLAEDGDDLVGRMESNTDYSRKLNDGTERMAARPFLTPLGTTHRASLQAAFVEGAKA